jgi:hypothetical protein
MISMTRLVAAFVVLTVVSLACVSLVAATAQQKELDALGKLLSGLVVKQVFTGTINITDVASGTSTSKDVIGTSTSSVSLNHNAVFTVTPGNVVARITYEEKTRVDSRLAYQTHAVVGYKTTEMTASGTNTDQTTMSFSVDLRSDGTYQIRIGTGGIQGAYKMEELATTTCNPGIAGSTCRGGTTTNKDAGTPPGQGAIGASMEGVIDKKQPNVLVGSMTEVLTRNDGSTGRRTITWNLSR